MDHGGIPAWRRGIDLAHSVCAAVAEGPLSSSDAGRRLRRAAVSVPSLVGEAFLDLTAKPAADALAQASEKLQEVSSLLTLDPVRRSLPEGDREALLLQIEALRAELADLRGGSSGH